MKNAPIVLAMLLGFISLATAEPALLQTGESFVKAQARLYAAGWRADPRSHISSGEYMGLDRLLIQNGYMEVDYCSVGKSFCTLQYIKGDACLRVQTIGEDIRSMKIARWSGDCREREADEPDQVLPADVRYLAQWDSDCERFGQCAGIEAYLRRLKMKYLRNQEVMTILDSYEYPAAANGKPKR